MKKKFRSDCPISSSLDIFGDKWTLIIIRELMYYGERTFKDFSSIKEKISTARLSDRLGILEKDGFITKDQHPNNKKVFLYNLTEKGKGLTPILAEMILWGNSFLGHHISESSKKLADELLLNREEVIKGFMK